MLSIIDKTNMEKLEALNNKKVMAYVEEAITLCKPAKVTVLTDSDEDIKYIRNLAIKNSEEATLNTEGHTIHFDGINDQARDKANTKYLLSKEVDWGMDINYVMKDTGLPEVRGFLDGSMVGKEMIIAFFCLGPTNSDFSISALQITDSSYVVHSETILYRSGYEQFKRLNGSDDFFFFLHSAGELAENNTTKSVENRRIYMDLDENRVYTVNNQYAGNSVGLKKLAFRLAIQKAQSEGWLAEHMFVMGVHGKNDRITYFAGAFPSACGKTSTAMIPGQTIVGDDIAYLKKVNGEIKSVNVEQGVFGIIRDVNANDDPVIYNAITTPREVIFSNILINDGKTYWLGMGEEIPSTGVNFAGEWTEASGETLAHKNARYTVRISELENADVMADAPEGVTIQGLVYGGRDSDTTVPVVEALDWVHGVVMGSTIESETTAATLGAEGVRKHNPMANLDFISVPLRQYIQSHIDFDKDLKVNAKVYSTNYFLKNDKDQFSNSKLDKKIWLLWAEGRINGEYDAYETPVGFIPKYEDLKVLFKDSLQFDYPEADYIDQFSIRIDKYIEKMDRMNKVFENVDVPKEFGAKMLELTTKLADAKKEFGSIATPTSFA